MCSCACRIHRSLGRDGWCVTWRFFGTPLREDPVWPWRLHYAWLPEWASAAEAAGFTGLPKVSIWITLTDSTGSQMRQCTKKIMRNKRCCTSCSSIKSTVWYVFVYNSPFSISTLFPQSCWTASVHVLDRRAGFCPGQLWPCFVVRASCLITMYFNCLWQYLPNTPNSHCVFCSTSGQWEEAVQVYNSTPLQELSDLTGLALAYCRAGLIPESTNGEEWETHWNQRLYMCLHARVTEQTLVCLL